MAILYISHDLPSVAVLCDRVAILNAGQILENNTTEAIFSFPKDAYTQRLVRAIPSLPSSKWCDEASDVELPDFVAAHSGSHKTP